MQSFDCSFSVCVVFFFLSFGSTHSALVEISIPGISEICSLDFHSDFNLSHAIYNFCEMLCSESCSEYEAPHMVYYESEFPEFVPSSHGICLISRNFDSEFSELVQSLHQICMISRNFDGEFLELDQSSHHICMIFRNVDKDFLDLVQPSHDICVASRSLDNEFLEFVLSSRHISMISINVDSEFLVLFQLLHDIYMASRNFDGEFSEHVQPSHFICMEPRYFDKESSEVALSLHDVCLIFRSFAPSLYHTSMTFIEFVLPLYNICLICKYSRKRDKTCNVMDYDDAFIDFVLFACHKCTACEAFLKWNQTYSAEHYAVNFFAPVCSLEEYCVPSKEFWKEPKICKFKGKKFEYLQTFYCFMPCFIFLAVYRCNILFFRLWAKDGYAFQWVGQFLRCVSAFLYHCCISRGGGRGAKMMIEEDDVKEESDMVDYIKRNNDFKCYFFGGGRHQTVVDGGIVYEYLQNCTDTRLLNDRKYFEGREFEFKRYERLTAMSNNVLELTAPLFFSKIPLDKLSIYLNVKEIREMSSLHNIIMPYKAEKKKMLTYFSGHSCNQCEFYTSVLMERKLKESKKKKKEENLKEGNLEISDLPSKFPPDPPSKNLIESIISGFCSDTTPEKLIEIGCAVCGKLSPVESMILLDEIDCDLNVISPGDVGRCERLNESDPIMPLHGPILAEDCDHVCGTCVHFMKKKETPLESLANYFWIGSVPLILQDLTFAEKMLISRIRHNKCLVRVSSGRAKMIANVIMFSNPTVKVYHALPPSRREISEILAFVFRGPIQPTDSDIKRTPMLVHRNIVKDALEWLKLNHVDYEDLHISLDNLNEYPLEGVPVNIEYSKSDPDSGNKFVSAMSVHDDEFEDGTADGPCPFTVHGLIGPEFENMSIERLKARALQHLAENGSTLGISHDSKPQSMYDNPQAYPQMFPWLFPYGFGGIGQRCHFGKISEATHKLKLLMYHDKRFQTDLYFPMIAFNHEQLKAGITGSFLLAKRKMWPDISNRLKTLNHDVLKNISDKLSEGAKFSPTTVEEKKCFQLLNDLDHVGGFVKGSITSKKHM